MILLESSLDRDIKFAHLIIYYYNKISILAIFYSVIIILTSIK